MFNTTLCIKDVCVCVVLWTKLCWREGPEVKEDAGPARSGACRSHWMGCSWVCGSVRCKCSVGSGQHMRTDLWGSSGVDRAFGRCEWPLPHWPTVWWQIEQVDIMSDPFQIKGKTTVSFPFLLSLLLHIISYFSSKKWWVWSILWQERWCHLAAKN